MKPANFLHMFALILLTSFAFNEHSNLKENFDARMYDLRVAKSHTNRLSGKTEEGKAAVARMKQMMQDTEEEYKFQSGLSGYKALGILFLGLFALWQFALYFKTDFDDPDDQVTGINYQRKTWLLNFFMFFTVSGWCLYFRHNTMYAVIAYLVAIGSLLRSLMLATELRLITRKNNRPAFIAVTVVTSVILYFNLILLAAIYYTSMVMRTSLIEELINLGK